jgi:F-type H+-transporting ATPase subunit epsilon
MAKELQVEIISPNGFLFDGNCHLVTMPCVNGDMGIMFDHQAILSSLREGKVTIFDNQQNILQEFFVKSGFAEMFNNKLLILVD